MAYEYRSGSQSLELPNPYAIENRVRFAVGTIFGVTGIALLFVARGRLSAGWNASTIMPLIGAVALLAYAVRVVAVAMSQLRFFFGRDRPNSLANELSPDEQGGSPGATELQETVRRGALQFPEPQGAINGVLYNLQRNLIYAPAPLQWLAQTQFRIAMVVSAISAAFLVSLLLLGHRDYGEWLGVLYFGLTAFVVLRPMRVADGPARVSDQLPVLLAVLAIIGPVVLTLIGAALPSIASARLLEATACMLLATGAGAALFILALRAQLGEPPPASTSMHQLAVSMNCQPAQVMDELARRLQENWREQIPNRRYIVTRPDINLTQETSGSFVCDEVEESQPFPAHQGTGASLAECLTDPGRKHALYLQLFGAALLVAAALIVGYGAVHHTIEQMVRAPAGAFNTLLFAGACAIVGDYCFRGAHLLFGRFDFESVLYWFELRGNYQVASLDYGNLLHDRLKTSKNLINIETATLRVWIVELSSVVFGKDGKRIVRAMTGRKQEAQALAESLARFGQEQSVVIGPTGQQDTAKLAAMARLSGGGTAVATADQAALAALGLNQPLNQPFDQQGNPPGDAHQPR